METRKRIIKGKEYTYVCSDEIKEFLCDRCNKIKKSKKHAEYEEEGTTKTICNACYGYICSK